MKVYLLLNQSYPNGYALTKRFHLYAKGIIYNEQYAKIIIPQPTEKEKSENVKTSGIFDDVPFQYTWKSTIRSKNFIARRYHDLIGALKVGSIIFKENPDVIITSSFSFYFHIYLKIISLFSSFIIIKEKNEIDYLRKDSVSKTDIFKIRILNKLFHGFIVINEQLYHYMNLDLKDKKPKIVVPILVEDFTNGQVENIQNTIVYTGTYLERKDGILSIIQAFSKIRDKYASFRLILTGSPNGSRDLPKINTIISENNLKNNVEFTGYLTEEDLQKVLKSAGILILAKPENRQNIYNFPTKIGEYLVSGRPVIATKVGVVGQILHDKKDIIFAEYDVDDITRKIEFLITNPALASEIGQRGKEFAQKNFDYKKHSKSLIDFFLSFK